MSTSKSKGYLFLASSLCDGLEDNNIKQVTTLLLNKEANPNTLIPTYGVTPFHLVIGNDSEAFAEEVTKLFLRHGGDPNVRSMDGLTPVHVAAAWGRVTVLELLLANGGDPLCLDDEGRSPFHYAFDGKYYKAIVVLGKYCENVIKEERATKHKMIFDKLLINSGDIVAEYVAPQILDMNKEHILNENKFMQNEDGRLSAIKNKQPFDFSDNSLNRDNLLDINVVELRIRAEIDKEKCLVNEIINQLSNSLKSNAKDKEHNSECEQSKESQYDTSPSSVCDNSTVYDIKDKFLLKTKIRKRTVTPKYRRKILMQNNNTNISIISTYDPNDSIISKSPNLLIGKSVEERQRYTSPKVLNTESKFKAFTPCMTRNKSFRSEEFDLGKGAARSTPRKKRRFYRQYSSLRKLKKNNQLTSSENTSPDSANSLSPDQNHLGKSYYRFNKNLAVKLHENKYDDDVPVNLSFNENEDYTENCTSTDGLMAGLNDNLKNLDIAKADSSRESKEDLKKGNYVMQEKFLEELKTSDISNTFKENFNILLSSLKSESYISVQEDYKYEDPDEGIAFLERRIYTLPPCQPEGIHVSLNKMWPPSLNLSLNTHLTNEALRKKLINLGDNPGPITSTTRQVYLKRLINLENGTKGKSERNVSNLQSLTISDKTTAFEIKSCTPELKSSLVYGDWVNHLGRYKIIEKNIFKEFSVVDPSRKWREGINKASFNYLLLDPRITKDLPSRAENLTMSTIWSTFLSAIFYVGKGTRNRPYSHLKDAFEAWVSNQSPDSTKIQHILSVWNDGYGVICLHVFQNVIPVEAYTREAAIIDTLGVQKLKNCKRGDYYGIAATWNIEEKRNFGRYLLYQIMQIFLYEGERHIFPQNL